MKVSQLKYNPANPRKISPEHLDKLKKSITEFPEMMKLRPIVYDPNTMHILGGNQRLTAIKALGMKEIPDEWAVSASELTDQQKKEFTLKDNIPLGEWDFDLLSAEFGEFDLADMGIDMPEMLSDPTEVTEDGYEAPDDVSVIETDIKRGDIIEIGKHRLMCGDSTNEADVALLMDSKMAEMLFTSPPYSDMRDYTNESDLSIESISKFIPAFGACAKYQVVNLGIQRKNNEVVQYWDEYIAKAKAAGYKLLSWNVWHKTSAGSIGNQSAFFPLVHEWIFVFGYDFKDINRTVDRKTEIRTDRTRKVRQKDGSMKESTIGEQLKLKEMESVFYSNPDLTNIRTLHPAVYPIELPSEYIKAMTNSSEIIADSFIGSGTTMVACHQLNRICYGMEISPQYCQVIIDRMEKLDPTLDIKVNGIPYVR